MVADILADCIECGGRVEMRPRPDCRWQIASGEVLPFPADHPVPSCVDCGEYYLDEPMERALDAAVRATRPDAAVASDGRDAAEGGTR